MLWIWSHGSIELNKRKKKRHTHSRLEQTSNSLRKYDTFKYRFKGSPLRKVDPIVSTTYCSRKWRESRVKNLSDISMPRIWEINDLRNCAYKGGCCIVCASGLIFIGYRRVHWWYPPTFQEYGVNVTLNSTWLDEVYSFKQRSREMRRPIFSWCLCQNGRAKGHLFTP